MAKKKRADLPLAEELLDRGVALLEGPLNRVVERALKSRLVLVPVGVGLKVALKAAALVVPPPPWTPPKGATKARPTTHATAHATTHATTGGPR
jgi:hypothetical protein